jgi:hypothetical protein
MLVILIARLIMVLTGERSVVSTLAGGVNGTNAAYSDASGTNAGFNLPRGLAVDASGNVFVVDYLNHCIRKVTPGGGTRIGPTSDSARACCADMDVATRARTGRACQ